MRFIPILFSTAMVQAILEERKIMTAEELLRPRYQVIADYPHGVYEKGDIVGQIKDRNQYLISKTPNSRGDIIEEPEQFNYFPFFVLDQYPHLFRKLPWWEGRELKDMPDHVRPTPAAIKRHITDKVYKVKSKGPHPNPKHVSVNGSPFVVILDSDHYLAMMNMSLFVSSTKEEYEKQHQK